MSATCTPDLRELLVEYAIGSLDADAAERVEAHLSAGCRTCGPRWMDLEAIEDALQSAAPPVPPSPRARERVLEIANESQVSRLPGPAFQLWPESTWREIRPGVTRCDLLPVDGASSSAYVIRIAPGAVVPRHGHSRTEHCFVLWGSCTATGDEWDGERPLRAGDYHRADAGTQHGFESAAGCDVLVVEAA